MPAPLPMSQYGTPMQPTVLSLSGNNANNSQGAPAAPGPTTPTPGSFVVHLNGKVFVYFALSGSTANDVTFTSSVTTTTAASTVPQIIPWNVAHAATLYSNANGIYTGATGHGLVHGDTYDFFHHTGSSAGGLWAVTTPASSTTKTTTTTNKLNPQQFLGYFRMYPGLDAMATNGLRYGGIVEIRQNFIGASQGSGSSASPVGPAGANAQNEGASASGNSSGSTLYVRREAAYVGSNEIGIFRFGQDDGPFSQFDGGVTTFQNFNDGAWNGDLPSAIPGNAQPTFPFWSGVGKEYAAAKGVYLSPQFAGFDFAASYAPSTAAESDTACNIAFSGCAALATSSTVGDQARATNWYELAARYQATFNGFGVYAMGGYSGSGNVNPGAPITAGNLYKPFSVGDAGLVLSFAGFSVGGNILFGQYEGQVALTYKGGVNSIAWIAGAQYANGPITFGASYFNMQSQGSNATDFTSQRYDEGFAAGLTYAVAPGMNAFASFLWGQAHQGGMDLLTGSSNAAENPAGTHFTGGKETVSGQAFMFGTQVKW